MGQGECHCEALIGCYNRGGGVPSVQCTVHITSMPPPSSVDKVKPRTEIEKLRN